MLGLEQKKEAGLSFNGNQALIFYKVGYFQIWLHSFVVVNTQKVKCIFFQIRLLIFGRKLNL